MLIHKLAAVTLLVTGSLVGGRLTAAERELPLLFKDDFEKGMDHWQTTDPKATESVWTIIEAGKKGNHALRVTGPSKYEPPYRSPLSIAFIKDIKVGDFELTVDVQNTNTTAGPHRDLCLFWGYQDPAHFYYVHYGAQSDPNACQIFIVNKANRKPITVKTAKGTPWTDNWHKLKVVRNAEDGTMAAYFDDMKTPHLTAKDKTFTWGQIGIGTFDDHGNFDNVVLRGEKVK